MTHLFSRMRAYFLHPERSVEQDVTNSVVITGDNNSVHLGNNEAVRSGAANNEWPKLLGRVPQMAACFQPRTVGDEISSFPDRKDTDAEFHSDLSGGHYLLTGMGGVGKTQLAASVAHAHIEHWRNSNHPTIDLIVWITADSKDAIVSSYAKAGDRITAIRGSRSGSPNYSDFLSWLSHTTRRWLIVLDDLQKPSDISGLWPPLTPNGIVIATTRRRDLPPHEDRRTVDVGLFSEQESLHYLDSKLRGSRHYELDDLKCLSRDLGYLPLALAQASATIFSRNYTVSHYRRRLDVEKKRLADAMPDAEALPDDHTHTVSATWFLSIEYADELPPAGLARPLLELASLLDPNGIPVDVFYASSVLQYASSIRQDSVRLDPGDIWDALQNLHRLNLADVDGTDTSRCVRVHALVQRATREELVDRIQALVSVIADACVDIMWTREERADKELLSAWHDNVDSLRENGEEYLWDSSEGVHSLLFLVGDRLGKRGNYRAASDHFYYVHLLALKKYGEEHPDSLSAHFRSAYWMSEEADAAGSSALWREVFEGYLQAFGPRHPQTLVARRNLAYWLGVSGDSSCATSELKDLLEDELQALGSSNPQKLITQFQLAYWQGMSGNIEEASSNFEDLLNKSSRMLGSQNSTTAWIRRSLLDWRIRAGDSVGAAATLKDIVSDDVRRLGRAHSKTLATRRKHAHWLGVSGKAEEAANTLEGVLVDELRRFGSSCNLRVLKTRGNLAYWRGISGDPRAAASALRELFQEYYDEFGPDFPQALGIRTEIAYWLGVYGDSSATLAELELLLADEIRNLGDSHPQVSITSRSIAYWQSILSGSA